MYYTKYNKTDPDCNGTKSNMYYKDHYDLLKDLFCSVLAD